MSAELTLNSVEWLDGETMYEHPVLTEAKEFVRNSAPNPGCCSGELLCENCAQVVADQLTENDDDENDDEVDESAEDDDDTPEPATESLTANDFLPLPTMNYAEPESDPEPAARSLTVNDLRRFVGAEKDYLPLPKVFG